MAALTLAEAKKYLRYEAADTSNDDALNLIIDAGQRYIENYTGHILVQRQVTETLTTFPVARITGQVPYHDLRWKPYVADTLAVTYLDAVYESAEFEDVTIYNHAGATRVIPTSSWPGAFIGVTLTYSAGYATAAAVPDDLMLALAVFASMTDEERSAPESNGWKSVHSLLEFYHTPVLA